MQSVLGPIYLVASDLGIRGVHLGERQSEIPLLKDLIASAPEERVLKKAVRELTEYLAGERQEFSVALDFRGTPFQESVWSELLKIPYGKTRSYAEVASRIKNPQAVRAVGGANGKNPICIIVPCHRVIASSGSLGGYSGGVEVKKKLLEIEKNGVTERGC